MKQLILRSLLPVFAICGGLLLTACEKEPFEEAGERTEEAIDDAGDAIDDAMDEAGDALEDIGD